MRCFLLVALLLSSFGISAQPSKADRFFIKNGLFVQALCFGDHQLHLGTLRDCGFSGTIWGGPPNVKQMGPPPGLPWARWMMNDTDRTLTPEELPYQPSLFALQFHDEQNLNSDKTLAAAKKWFDEMRPRYPNVILYTNQYGGLLTDPNMQRYIETCKPDMLSFDTYPIWETQDNWRSYFGDLQRYRAFSTGAGIPFQAWIQTFNGENKYRNPSESELRLDVFGAWAFGAKMLSCFTYNAGSTCLFRKTFNGSGDINPTAAYGWMKQILFESRNLSPYLSKVRCVDARWVLGKGSEYPWGVGPWQFDKERPEIHGITVKNLGRMNNNNPGDAAITFFKPIEGGEDEKWVMVTNALAGRNGTAAVYTQRITLNLVLKGGQTLEKVNRRDGKLERPELKQVGEAGRYLLELDLPGGTGDLIRFRTK